MAVDGGTTKAGSIVKRERTYLSTAQARGILDHRIEDWSKFIWRGRDNSEHLGSSGLLLERLAQFVEQPCILDGDDCLGGEVCHQLDLLVVKGPDLLAVNSDRADNFLVLDHRHSEQSANACDIRRRDRQRVAAQIGRIGSQVRHLDWLT